MEETKETSLDELDNPPEKQSNFKKWFKRVGIAGFLFFFIKGLVWLAIIFWAGKCAVD